MKKRDKNWLLWALLLWINLSVKAQPGWGVNPASFQYNMTMVACIKIDGIPHHETGNYLAVFLNGRIRGYATPVIFSGQAYYFLNLYANAYKGDTLCFRAFIGADGKVYESQDTVIFQHQLAVGTIGEPFQVRLHLGDRPLIYSLPDVNYSAGGYSDILDIQATDKQNSEGDGLAYAIAGGADATRFAINPQTGVLSWENFAPAFAPPQDADGDNRYEVDVTVTDASNLSDLQHVSVALAGLSPLPPLVCPPSLNLASSDDGNGDCGTSTDQAGIPIPHPCVAQYYYYEIFGATNGGGNGPVPSGLLFATGASTVVYIRSVPGETSSECAFTVTVTDDEIPEIVCPDDLTVQADEPDNCTATVENIDAACSDNCTGVYLTWNTSGASPGSGDGQASGQVFQQGATTVTYTVSDAASLTATCSFNVTVASCQSGTTISGTVIWENDGSSGVKDVIAGLSGDTIAAMTTLADGNFAFSIANGENFTLTPAKNINKLNGVTTADVTAIQQHAANASLLAGPFKRIAADVNKSNSITSLDATLLNQALLGNPSALNQINSWRFVPASYIFPNPNVPWGFPEQINLTGVNGLNSARDFKGIKLGDVVATWANPANLGSSEAGELVLWVQDQVLQAGSEIIAEFRADQLDDLNAFQFALHFDPQQLQLTELESLSDWLIESDHFGAYNLANGEIRVAWAQSASLSLSEAKPLFRLRFVALQSGAALSNVLHLAAETPDLPGRAYDSNFADMGVKLRFSELTGTHTGGAVPTIALQVFPNPASGEAWMDLHEYEGQSCIVRLADVRGVLLWETKVAKIGKELLRLNVNGLASGLYFLRIMPTGDAAQTLKLQVRQE